MGVNLYRPRTFTSTALNEGRSECRQLPTATTRRGGRMRGLGRRTRWLGWVVAGVLLVSAGGAALAAQSGTTTTQGPSASAPRDKARARAGWRHALGRRMLHGEVTLQTKAGVKTIVMARGSV